MPLTNENLKEIKTAVNQGFGFNLTAPSGTKPQMLVVYKEYLVTPVQRVKTGPGSYKSVYRRSPTEPYLPARSLLPRQKLSPSKYGINNLLLKVNGRSPSPRTLSKTGATPRKRSPSAKL